MNDKEKQRIWAHDWYIRNKEKVKKATKKWKEENHEKHRIYNRKYWKKVRDQNRDAHNNYKRIHRIIGEKKPKQEICTICNQYKELQLANISGEYKDDVNDFMWLCRTCHIFFDKINKTHEVSFIGIN